MDSAAGIAGSVVILRAFPFLVLLYALGFMLFAGVLALIVEGLERATS